MRVRRFEKLDFVILNRNSFCRASAIILDRKDYVETSI